MQSTGSFGHDSPGLRELSQLSQPPTWEQVQQDHDWSALFWAWLGHYGDGADVSFWDDANRLALDFGSDMTRFLVMLNNMHPSTEWTPSGRHIIADATIVFHKEQDDPDWRSLSGPDLLMAVSSKSEHQPEKSLEYTTEVRRLWTVQITEVLRIFHHYCQQLAASAPDEETMSLSTPEPTHETMATSSPWQQSTAMGKTGAHAAEEVQLTITIHARGGEGLTHTESVEFPQLPANDINEQANHIYDKKFDFLSETVRNKLQAYLYAHLYKGHHSEKFPEDGIFYELEFQHAPGPHQIFATFSAKISLVDSSHTNAEFIHAHNRQTKKAKLKADKDECAFLLGGDNFIWLDGGATESTVVGYIKQLNISKLPDIREGKLKRENRHLLSGKPQTVLKVSPAELLKSVAACLDMGKVTDLPPVAAKD